MSNIPAYRGLDKLVPSFAEKVTLFIQAVRPYGVYITETWRSPEKQHDEFEEGQSDFDGYVKIGNHQKGIAIDVAFTGAEMYPKDISAWRKVADIAKQFNIDWGFDLWGKDKPHFQDNGKLYNSPQFLYDSATAVQFCKDMGIISDWSNPQDIPDAKTLELIWYKAKLIQQNSEKGMTRERLAMFLYRLLNK